MDGFKPNQVTGIPRIDKSPGADLPYTIDWYPWLRGDDLYWSEFPSPEQAAKRFYHAGQTVTPSRDRLNGHRYQAQNAGVIGAAEPAWPTGSGATVVDGSITWKEIGPEDTLDSVVHEPAAPLTKDTESNDDTTSTVELSGGSTAGTVHRVSMHVVTTLGREDDRSFDVVMRDR